MMRHTAMVRTLLADWGRVCTLQGLNNTGPVVLVVEAQNTQTQDQAHNTEEGQTPELTRTQWTHSEVGRLWRETEADGQIKRVSEWTDGGKGKDRERGEKREKVTGKQETRIHPTGAMVQWSEPFNERYRGSKSQKDQREIVGEIRGHNRWVEEWLIAEREREESHADEAKSFLTFSHLSLFAPQELTVEETMRFLHL